jgi:alkylation response protein AidB-like acyl-CoA dehydrogenase
MRVSDLDPDGIAYREAARRLVSGTIRPRLAGTEATPLPAGLMGELFRAIGPTGYFGTRVSPQDGGSGLPKTLAGVLLEELPAFLGAACVSHEATTYRTYLAAPSPVRDRYLPKLVSGELIGGTAVSEAETGSDSNHPRTRFSRVGDRVEVRGAKLWITNASVADVLMVAGRDEDTGRVARLLVDTRETKVNAREIPMLGLRRGHLCEVQVVGTVPAANILADQGGSASSALARAWTMNRVSMALLALAIGRRAVAEAIVYSRARQQFDRPIGQFQLVQALLADAYTSVEAGRLLCYQALSALDDGVESTRLCAMAKLFGTEAAIQAVIKAQQAVGTFGVSSESPFDEWYRDVRMFTFPDGTTQIQQLLLGRDLTGLSAFR